MAFSASSSVAIAKDEADALFGKRTQVRDSRDRNANLETNYLLQRIEAYQGLAILTTNLYDAIDSAFMRRIRFIVRSEFPYAQERIEIWKRIFPAQTPTEGLDYNKLSRLDANGATIRNVAMNGALNASNELEVSKAHISNDKSSSKITHIDNHNISEEWHSITELLNQTSINSVENMPLPILSNTNQSIPILNNWNLLTLANFGEGSNQEYSNTFTQENFDGFELTLNREKGSNDTPDIWSSITELLGENIPSSGVNSSWTNENEFSTPSANDSTATPTSFIELSNPSPSAFQEQIITLEARDVNTSNSLISEEEMEMLIYHVYIILCHRLELNHKRQLYPGTSIQNSWNPNFWKAYPRYSTGNWTMKEVRSISDDSKIVGNYNDIFLLNTKLSILAQEVYALIKHRLDLKITRYGNESLSRFML